MVSGLAEESSSNPPNNKSPEVTGVMLPVLGVPLGLPVVLIFVLVGAPLANPKYVLPLP